MIGLDWIMERGSCLPGTGRAGSGVVDRGHIGELWVPSTHKGK